MTHVLVGRVVLGESGGVGVEGAVAEAVASGPDGTPEDTVSVTATTGADGRFLLVYLAGNVQALKIRVSAPSGVLVEEREPRPPGDNQDTFDDLGEFVLPYGDSGLVLRRRTPAAPPRPRITGRVVDSGGECGIHCLQVLFEAAPLGEPDAFRPVAVARTDRSGRFFADYPSTPFSAVRAVIPGVEQPISVPTTEQGLIGPDPLLVIDLDAAQHAHETSGCDCGSADTPRLPGQEELAQSSTYTTDLGAGCVTFNTPNRAIEEFDFWTVVRTSQPPVRELNARSSGLNPLPAPRQELADQPIAWDEDPSLYQAAGAAHGHLLHFRQTWFADGYSLGDLLYSLPLAPGQKKLISVVEWERSESVGRQEDTTFSESVVSDLQHKRDITEVINAALSEQSRGGSTSSTWGVGTGTGGAGNGSYQGFNFGALFGISGGYSRADSEAWQDSSRNLASTSMNALRDNVLQAASAVRGIRSTVVTTVGQSEAVRAETDVVANHNRCHALTIQYFEVLRHFQMRHELVEVKECLFVPLPLGPFDGKKVLRWRDQITPYLLRPDLVGAVEALRRLETNWAETPTPVGRYADEAVVEISGEFDLEFQAYPPPLPDPEKADPVANALEQSAGAVIASIFFPPLAVTLPAALANAATGAVSGLKALRTEELRFRKFHRDHMPRFAARFVDKLSLVVRHTDGSRTTAEADFTLVSRYQPDRPLVVGFKARISGITRADIDSVFVEADTGVPDAVRCLVRGLRCDYATSTFGHRLAATSRLNDDLDGPRLVPTGTWPFIQFGLDPSTADPVRVRTPLDPWERRSPRDEDRRLAARLLDHMNANLEYYHHAIWWTMDPNRRYLLLDGYLAPNGGGRSIAQVVENKLIGIVGNSLVLPVAPGTRLDPLIRMAGTGLKNGTANGGTSVDEADSSMSDVGDIDADNSVDIDATSRAADPTGLLAYYAPPTPVPPARVSLPTKGVFAEAVMGACNACERIDDSRFWKWEQSPLDEPPAIEPASTGSRRSEPQSADPTDYPTPIVSIQNAPAAPAPTDLTKVFELLGRAVFGDITGLSGTQANAAATYKQNLDTALAFGKEASELAKQAGMLNAKDKAFASIDAAEADGKITQEEAHDLRLSAFKKMVGEADSTSADVEATKKRLTLIDEAGRSGVVDGRRARELAGTVLDDFARGDRPQDPEREAAARKIDGMPPAEVSTVDVQRADGTTRVEAGYRLTGADGRAPAHKTGVGGVTGRRPPERSTAYLQRFVDWATDLAEAAIASEDEKLGRALADAAVEIAKVELAGAVDQVPMGRALRLAVRYSVVFAEGAGTMMDAVREDIRKVIEDAVGFSGDNGLADNGAAIQRARSHQQLAVERLPDVLKAGLTRVVDEMLDTATGALAEAAGKVTGQITRNIAERLVKSARVDRVLLAVTQEAGNDIPAARRKAYVHLSKKLARLAIATFADSATQRARLEALLPKNGEDPAVGLLRALVELGTAQFVRGIDPLDGIFPPDSQLHTLTLSDLVTYETRRAIKAIIDELKAGQDGWTFSIRGDLRTIDVDSDAHHIRLPAASLELDPSPPPGELGLLQDDLATDVQALAAVHEGLETSLLLRAWGYQADIDEAPGEAWTARYDIGTVRCQQDAAAARTALRNVSTALRSVYAGTRLQSDADAALRAPTIHPVLLRSRSTGTTMA